MSPDFDPTWLSLVGIAKPVLLSSVAKVALLAGATVSVAFVLAPRIRRAIDPAREDQKRLSELVPLRMLLSDNQTIANEDGRLSHVYCIDGADIGSMTAARISTLDINRIAFLKAVREVVSRKSGVEIKFLLERCRRGRLDEQEFPQDQEVMGRISAAWRKGFKTRFETRYYIVVSVGPKTRAARETLEEVWRAAQTALKEFRPVRLGQSEPGISELLGFWNRWMNGGMPAQDRSVDSRSDDGIAIAPPGRAAGHDIDIGKMIGRCEVVFNAPKLGMILFQDGDRMRYCRALEIRQFPGGLEKGVVLDILALPIEARVLLQTRILSQTEVQAEVQVRRMYAGENLKLKAAEDLEEVADMGEVTWAETRFTVFVFADTQYQLEEHLDAVRAEISNKHYMEMVTLGAGVELVWQALMPGKQWIRNDSFLPDQVMAEMTAFFRANRGFDASDFGPDPIAVFQTALGDMYNFTFHRGPDPEEPGHTMVIGGTGNGKTFLIEFLTGMSLRFPNLRSFIFDALYGCYVFTQACNGKYWSLGNGDGAQSASLNPLQMDLGDHLNKEFLRAWMELLGDVEGLPTQEQKVLARADISEAVTFLSKVDPSNRSLSYIYNGSFSGSILKEPMKQWVDPDQNGLVFNGRRDSLNLDRGRVVAFDMTHMRQQPELLRTVMPYLIHRIRNSVVETGSPYLVVFEETSHMLRIPALATFIQEELQQARKRHGVAVLAFQEPEGVTQSPAASAILSNVMTQIFLPNPGAQRERYAAFGLEDHEWAFIAGMSEASSYLKRPALVRKRNLTDGWTSVVIETDMSVRLGPLMSLFKSGSDYAELCRKSRQLHPNGMKWVDAYLEEVRRKEDRLRRTGNLRNRSQQVSATAPLAAE